MKFKIIIHPAEEGGFWAEVPALPGCYTQGESMDEILSNADEAIQTYLIGSQMIECESEALVKEIEIA